MKRLDQLIRRSVKTLFSSKHFFTMDSTSGCLPSPEKRIKLDVKSVDKESADESNSWRSLLARNFDEIDVGITEFIGDYKPFEGVLKNRYEDFLVHEISKSGQIIRLTDNSMPEEEVVAILDINEVLDDSTVEQIRQLLESNESDIKYINETTDAQDVEELIESQDMEEKCEPIVGNEELVAIEDQKNSVVKIAVNGLSKFERTRIHKAIKDNYEDLETITVDEDSDKFIVVKKFDPKSAKRRPNMWPKGKGEYIHFVLYKENKETQQSINELALKMHISVKTFETAGTKDKRAVTTQQVSAWKLAPKRIWAAAGNCSGVEVGHFRFEAKGLKLGDLWGNRFDIVLRDVKCEDRLNAEESLNCFKSIGFINYYGMQRFGYQVSKPYAIGIHILRQDWEQVVESILSPKPKDMRFHNRPDVMSFNECIDLWRKTRNPQLVYKKLPYKWTPEGSLLRGLCRVGSNDFHGAICTGLHRNQRLLYLHCYQSYIWNKTASFRVKTYGLKVVAGDLLQLRDKEKDPNDHNSNIVVADENHMKWASIHDIVIPVVGSENLMPTNSVSDYIKTVLSEDNITVDLYRDLPKQWCVFGTYRKLFIRPEDFEYQWLSYRDPNIPLIESDLKLMKERNDSKIETKLDFNSDLDSKLNKDLEKLCLKLSMSLPSSAYATMGCRQLTRTETTLLECKPWLQSREKL